MECISEKKVSIIVPVHNAANTLNRCVNSIMSQDYKNIECILVENASIDESKELCFEYAASFDNIIAVSCHELGVSNARNQGLKLATGDIIGFCDADDFLEPNAIKTIVSGFQNESSVVAIFSGFNIGVIDMSGNIAKEYRGLKGKEVSVSKAVQLTLINDSVMGSVWNKYYKADVLRNINFDISLSFCEDLHFNVKALNSIQTNKKVKIISEPLYCYMENLESVTHNDAILFNENNDLKYIVAFKKIEEDCELDKKTKELIGMKIACFSIDYIKNMKLDQLKENRLIIELKHNYMYLLRNITENNLKWNLKRVFQGGKILLIDNKVKTE